MSEQLGLDIQPPLEPAKPQQRCTPRKHVIEKGGENRNMCDCKKVMYGMTAAGNAHVVTIIVD